MVYTARVQFDKYGLQLHERITVMVGKAWNLYDVSLLIFLHTIENFAHPIILFVHIALLIKWSLSALSLQKLIKQVFLYLLY